MTVELFDRRCSVVVDALQVDGLRMSFKAHKDNGAAPNTAEIQITNLSAASRARMQEKGAKIILSAGYVGNAAIIFSGDARLISHVRQGSDWVTRIQSGDGERAYAYARASESFRGGTSVASVLQYLVRQLGVDPGNLAQVAQQLTGQFVNGYTAHGKASAELDTLLRSQGFEWSIQDGRLQILKPNEATTDQAVVLGPTTGLVGSPELGTGTKKSAAGAVRFRSLLQPRLKPGAKVKLESVGVNGVLKVQRVDHRGDTAGGDWYSDCEAVPIT